ncbi:type-F conjugative transfer system pilin assembly protein TraF [Citrobacter amalonaticus]|uniref:type-F conjugative transfer system pilin assembly protein TraF n=1 Tax=Citrobacter amalonaticus TaxID=35703 RepID=UPI0024A61C6E|nr:type-F conjugative transfer system pilin assembly protein TraF [Citrobacter amalonaticus]MDT7072811.1 type-F conjugative transfer system pilin assembly protein TraF [Citrobacter amalonaticus]HED3078467.1 type-F conjugative transfer system pilin assembly protein TraF [Citrobacter amalonaticus]HED3672160.1 type-F conjugative transfer system pilin assembly protein TraF [Citrobacter amalonaticus]HED3697705.1 type-F conjugative transfer system pilin assembly protein TraF [Citrobacter amalonaticus
MKRILTALFMAVLSLSAAAEEIITPAEPFTGWFWYNEPKKPSEPVKPPPPEQRPVPDFSKMTAVEQANILKGYMQEALNRAILNPTRENTATFLRWQKFWTDRASMFSQSFAAAQLSHPDLDYNLEYPHYNSMAPFVQTREQQKQQDAVTQLAQQYGMFYFYRGSDPIDVQMAGVVADFAKTNGISLIPVSVDGQIAATLPQSRPDTGQSRSMNIQHFPALMLVDPKSRSFRALSYGFMTQDDLSKRFLNVATGFKPNS